MSRQPTIGLFGATGFIGSNILKYLVEEKYKINVLVRKRTSLPPEKSNITIHDGSLENTELLRQVIAKSDILIYTVGIIREDQTHGVTFEKIHYEYFERIVDIANKDNIKKIIYISANGVDNLNNRYQTSKYIAEQYLKNNFNNWTIFRPSVVYGNPEEKNEFLTQLKNDIINKPIPAPLFFQINPFRSKSFFKSNPVHVNDLSKLIVKSIESDYSNNKIHKVGGTDETTWYSMLKSISRVLSKKNIFIPVPITLLQLLAILLERFSFFPITSIQLKMLKEDNICDSTDLFDQYNIIPTKFSYESISYLNQ